MAQAEVEAPHAALPSPATADAGALDALAKALAAAKRPVIVSEELGRDVAAVGSLVALAETLGAPVLDGWHADYVNFPRRHPLYAGVAVEPVNEIIREADFVLLAEATAPWHPASAVSGIPVAALGEDPLRSTLPFWGFRADHVVPGDPGDAIRRLTERLKPLAGDRRAGAARWGERNAKHRDAIAAQAIAAGGSQAISTAWVAHELNQALPPGAIVVNETISHRGDIMRLLDRLDPGGFFEASYGGLGMGLSTALGVKHAQPGRTVALVVGDGSFHYNPVIAAFGAAQEHALPLLVLLFDNGGYFSQKADVLRDYPQGHAVRERKFVGTSITPRPDYPLLARAYGGYGERVEARAEVRAALQRGLEAVSQGRLALLHVVLEAV